MEKLLESFGGKMSLTESESQKVAVSAQVWSTNLIKHELCLVGRILTRKTVNLEAFERTMLSLWNPSSAVSMRKVSDDRFQIQFTLEAEKERVTWRSPWAFDKQLVVLRKLVAPNDPLTVPLDECDFFVHVRGLPFHLLHDGMAKVLGNAVGRFHELDTQKNSSVVGSALRFRTRMDITKPIRRLIQVAGPDGQDITVGLAYERLQNFCYFCGIIGHLVKDCHACLDVAHPSGEVPADKLMYGDWLRAQPMMQQSKQILGSLNHSMEKSVRPEQVISKIVDVRKGVNLVNQQARGEESNQLQLNTEKEGAN